MKQTIEGWEEFFRDGVREGGRRNLKKKEGGRGRRVPRRGRGVGKGTRFLFIIYFPIQEAIVVNFVCYNLHLANRVE